MSPSSVTTHPTSAGPTKGAMMMLARMLAAWVDPNTASVIGSVKIEAAMLVETISISQSGTWSRLRSIAMSGDTQMRPSVARIESCNHAS